MKVGIILTNDERSRAYLQKLQQQKILLDSYVLMNNAIEIEFSKEVISTSKKFGFDISESTKNTLLKNNILFNEFNFLDINHPKLINFLKEENCDYFIFTGGGILKKDILNLPIKFIHMHPGIVPHYRGSTCFYYSILNEQSAGVTAFIMDKNLDTGNVIYQKKFEKPNHQFIDEVYDPFIRSETLMDILQRQILKESNFSQQDPKNGETYFIIHPVLKHIAILNCIN